MASLSIKKKEDLKQWLKSFPNRAHFIYADPYGSQRRLNTIMKKGNDFYRKARIGNSYDDFEYVSDEELIQMLWRDRTYVKDGQFL